MPCSTILPMGDNGTFLGCRREDVHHCRSRFSLRNCCECGVWYYLLGNTNDMKNGWISSAHFSCSTMLRGSTSAFQKVSDSINKVRCNVLKRIFLCVIFIILQIISLKRRNVYETQYLVKLLYGIKS